MKEKIKYIIYVILLFFNVLHMFIYNFCIGVSISLFSLVVEHSLRKGKVVGSNPITGLLQKNFFENISISCGLSYSK